MIEIREIETTNIQKERFVTISLTNMIGLFINIFLWSCVLSYILFTDIVMPKLLEHRAIVLEKMRYNSKRDEMMVDDSAKLDKFDFHYLQYGNMDGISRLDK